MTRAFILACLPATFLVLHAVADSDNGVRLPWLTASENGRFLFKMVNIQIDPKTRREIKGPPHGIAYEIDTAGQLVEQWRVEGWTASEGYLANDGRHFVRLGLWPTDQQNHADLAIAFYDRGILLKEYQVRELIKKSELIEESVSHYQWRPEKQMTPTGFGGHDGETFHLVLIDKTSYEFDVETGKIVNIGVNAGARSRRELWHEEQQAAQKRGRELYDSSDFHNAYDEHFTLSEISASDGKIYGVHFDDPEWRAHLVPKAKYAIPCMVEAVFPIIKDKSIANVITPEEIDRAFQVVLAHPLVAPKISSGAFDGMRMRITGDRLHWDSKELRGWLAEIGDEKPKEDDPLKDWAEIILDVTGNRGFDSFFFNCESGELLLEDKATSPNEHLLIDSSGAVKSRGRRQKPPM